MGGKNGTSSTLRGRGKKVNEPKDTLERILFGGEKRIQDQSPREEREAVDNFVVERAVDIQVHSWSSKWA